MFHWIFILRNLFPITSPRAERKARRPRPTKKPSLEVLEDRTLPSATPVNSEPQTQPKIVTMQQQAIQVIVTVENEVASIIQTETQEIAQADANLVQEWANLYNAIFNQNSSSIPLNPPSGRGSGSGAATTAHNTPYQQPNVALQQTGHGSGSGASTTAHEKNPTQGAIKPMTSPTGFGSALPAGSGSGSNSGSVTVYTWEPQGYGSGTGSSGGGGGNDLASNFHNWLKNGQVQNGPTGTVPGNKPTDEALFDGLSNDPIDWDRSFTFSTMMIGGVGAYTGEMYFEAGAEIDLTGVDGAALAMGGTSDLNFNFDDHAQSLEIDKNATITNMNVTGYNDDSIVITGGTTTIGAAAGLTENLGVNLIVGTDATLSDKNQSTLQLTQDGLIITVETNGNMYIYNGPNNSNTAIGGGATNTNDYIYLDGGYLEYYGRQNIKDIVTVPIAVESSGKFLVTYDPNSPKGFQGYLIVQGGNASTHNVSVYMEGVGSWVQFFNYATLECDKNYYQDSGTLASMDNTTSTLQAGASGAGTATIAGGLMIIDQQGGLYGTLIVNAQTLNFNGELVVGIDASKPGTSDLLSVPKGTTNLQANSTLRVYVNNNQQLMKNQIWTIIQDSILFAINGNFFMPITTIPQTNLTPTPRASKYFLLS